MTVAADTFVVSTKAASVVLFLREHQNVFALLELVDDELSATAADRTPDYELLLDIVHYLTSYIDRYHHTREDVAFELVARRLPRVAELVACVARQHVEVLAAGAALAEVMEQAFMDQPVARERALEAGAAYVNGLREHMQFEELSLFPLVATTLRDNDWKEIDARFDPPGDPLFGPVVDQRYRQLRDSLERGSTRRAAPRRRPPAAFGELALFRELDELERGKQYSTTHQAARTLVRRPDLRVVLVALAAGATLKEHSATPPVSIQTVSGCVRIESPRRSVEHVAGGLLLLEPGEPHSVRAIADSALLLSIPWSAAT